MLIPYRKTLFIIILSVNVNAFALTDNRGFPVTPSGFVTPSTNNNPSMIYNPPYASQPKWNDSKPRHHEHRHYFFNQIIYPNYPINPVYFGPIDDNSYIVPTSSTTITNTISPPNGDWVAAQNGDVPDGAIVFRHQNNVATYYCRITNNNQELIGELFANDACFISQNSQMIRYNNYEVLVNN